MHLCVRREVCVLVCLSAVLGTVTDVAAQDRKWTIDAHVGMLSGSDAVTGVPTLPPLGETFTPAVVPSSQVRRVSSWFFGDGSQQINARASQIPGRRRIVPLDSVLGRSLGSNGGVAFGGRVGRQLSTRLQLEGSIDFAPSRFAFDDDLLDAVEDTRASFEEAFPDLFSLAVVAGGNFTAASHLDVSEGSGHQLDVNVMATYDVAAWERFVPFVSGGGGWSSITGDGPSLTLSGNYSLQSSNPLTSPIKDADTVTLRFEPKATRPFADVGGGVRIPFSLRSGLRVDVRARIQSEGMQTTISADPTHVAAGPGQGTASFSGTPGYPDLLFTTANLSTNATLSGIALKDFETFSSSKTRTHVTASIGWFWKF